MLPDDSNPYAAPKTPLIAPADIEEVTQPEAVRYFRACCIIFGSLYLLCFFGYIYFHIKFMSIDENDGLLWRLALGFLILAWFYLGGLYLPRKPWAWWYGLCLLLLNVATYPFLVFWLGPRARRYYRG